MKNQLQVKKRIYRAMLLGCLTLTMIFMSCSGEDGADGEMGLVGADGTSCWDTSGDGIKDQDEDINGDGKWNALDCQGADGGNNGSGTDGEDGIDCWDTNGDRVNDPGEDTNGDGDYNGLDCQGEDGDSGAPGTDGNANVISFDKELNGFNHPQVGKSHIIGFNLINDLGIPAEDLPNYMYLFYLKIPGDGTINAVPGGISINGIKLASVYYFEDDNNGNSTPGRGGVVLSNLDGTNYDQTPHMFFSFLRIVAIEKSVLNKNGHTDPIKALKAAGVDVKDYHAVMQYFGLKE